MSKPVQVSLYVIIIFYVKSVSYKSIIIYFGCSYRVRATVVGSTTGGSLAVIQRNVVVPVSIIHYQGNNVCITFVVV